MSATAAHAELLNRARNLYRRHCRERGAIYQPARYQVIEKTDNSMTLYVTVSNVNGVLARYRVCAGPTQKVMEVSP